MLAEKRDILLIIFGIVGFMLLLLYDLASLKKIRYRYYLCYAGYGVQAYAIFKMFTTTAAAMQPYSGGWLLALVGFWWLLYCLFLFPPIRQTYRQENGPLLTTEGPYALVRHPGAYGYTALVLGLAFIVGSEMLLLSGVIWSCVNLCYIFIQDCFIFPRLISGYSEYRLHTPMLIPNVASMRRFWQTK